MSADFSVFVWKSLSLNKSLHHRYVKCTWCCRSKNSVTAQELRLQICTIFFVFILRMKRRISFSFLSYCPNQCSDHILPVSVRFAADSVKAALMHDVSFTPCSETELRQWSLKMANKQKSPRNIFAPRSHSCHLGHCLRTCLLFHCAKLQYCVPWYHQCSLSPWASIYESGGSQRGVDCSILLVNNQVDVDRSKCMNLSVAPLVTP